MQKKKKLHVCDRWDAVNFAHNPRAPDPVARRHLWRRRRTLEMSPSQLVILVWPPDPDANHGSGER
jgi:hypothetical protein